MKKFLFCVLVGVLCSLSSRAQGITEKNPLYAWKPGEIGNVYEKTLIVYEDYYGNKTKRVVKGVKIGFNMNVGDYFIVFPNENGMWEKICVGSSESTTMYGMSLYLYKGFFVDEHSREVGESVGVTTRNMNLNEFIRPRDGYSQGEDIDDYMISIANFESIEAGKRNGYTLYPHKNSQKMIELMEQKREEESRKRIEQARQERLKREEEERKRAEELRLERIRRAEEIKALLPSVDQQKIFEVYKKRVKEVFVEEEKKLKANYPIPEKKNISEVLEVAVHVDSAGTDVYKVNGGVTDMDLFHLEEKSLYYCTLDSVEYNKYQNHIFFKRKIPVEIRIEKGLLGVKNKNGVFKYYGDFPEEVKEWCKKHIVGSGFQAIQYTCCNGAYIVIPVTVSKSDAKIIQGKDLEKRKRVWSVIGGVAGTIAGLGVLGWLISLAG